MPDILILKGAREPAESSAHKTWQALQEIGNAQYFLESYADIVFRITNGEVSCYSYASGRDLGSYDLVYVRDFHGYEHERNAIALYLTHKSKRFINEDVGSFQHISKLTQYIALAINGVPVPDMVYAKPAYLAEMNDMAYPAVLKSVVGSNGKDNVLVQDREGLSQQAVEHGALQPFIPNDSDMRVVVADGEVLLAYKRIRSNPNDHRNNVAFGARREVIADLPEQVAHLAQKAARVVGRNLAGVDIIQDKETGNYYVLEVNFNFGMAEVEDGVAEQYYQRLAAYLERKAQ
jgi:glutathione synthase/RimK-type ligase-like ATP-grasp enzyme